MKRTVAALLISCALVLGGLALGALSGRVAGSAHAVVAAGVWLAIVSAAVLF